MKITADTNLLIRVAVNDDPVQARKAFQILSSAESVFIPLPCLCEFAWVLDSVYRLSRSDIAASIRALTRPANALFQETSVEVGLRVLDAGGDFADGAIAAAGKLMGSETFVSFDRKAVSRVREVGLAAEIATSLP